VARGRRRRQAAGHRTAPRTRQRPGRGSASPPRGSWRAGAGRAAPARAGRAGGNRWHGCCGRWSGEQRRRRPRAGEGGEDGLVGKNRGSRRLGGEVLGLAAAGGGAGGSPSGCWTAGTGWGVEVEGFGQPSPSALAAWFAETKESSK
jgi:hypothetical protein